jgi:antirestriction factor ArdC-like protein
MVRTNTFRSKAPPTQGRLRGGSHVWACNPFSFLPSAPRPGNPYSGCNLVLLWTAGDRWSAPRFLTFKGALELEKAGSGTHRRSPSRSIPAAQR